MNAPDLKIEIVVRDHLGAIVALITDSGVVDATTASSQISRGEARYVAGPDSWVRTPVKAMPGIGGGYLFANWDGSRRNNLHDLAPGRIPVRLPLPAEAEAEAESEPRQPGILSTIRRALRLSRLRANGTPCPPASPASC
ncbi:hypothetical protein [Leifsonia sp. NPDC058230]|uniref:hypothetical protein n=1 Tax=Leifsonia sp. NPDC058230 TaxID=3346391 RepID=UPI0036D89F1B